MKLQQLIFTGVLCLSSTLATATDLLEAVKANGVLKVGMEGTYPPFGYRNDKGELTGYDVDVATALAAKMGLKVEFVTGDFSGLIGGLQAGKFDVIANQIEISPKRKESLAFTQPYAYSALQLIQRKSDKNNYKSLADMNGKSLAVTLGSNYVEYAKTFPGVVVKTYPGTAEYMRDLMQERVDAAINDRLILPYLIKTSNLPLRPGALLSGHELEIGIPFKKGNPQFEVAINSAMNSLRKDGTLKKISLKWFNSDVTQPLK
jgi:cystine transport system substrate-binding protein